MARRKIIKIDQEKCTGCGKCIPNCPEGALQLIDGKARLISDLFCDGLGACIGYCPEGAITVEERQAQAYDEKKVMVNIAKQGKNVIKAHLKHLKDHGENDYYQQAIEYLKEHNIEIPLVEDTSKHNVHTHDASGCPGLKVVDFGKRKDENIQPASGPRAQSELRQWPIQLKLVPAFAPYLKDADLLIAADCCPFAYADFHKDFLRRKVLLMGCPKLDDAQFYKEKLTQIFKSNNIKSIACLYMEVPCCFGLVSIAKQSITDSSKDIPFEEITISIKGEKI